MCAGCVLRLYRWCQEPEPAGGTFFEYRNDADVDVCGLAISGPEEQRRPAFVIIAGGECKKQRLECLAIFGEHPELAPLQCFWAQIEEHAGR